MAPVAVAAFARSSVSVRVRQALGVCHRIIFDAAPSREVFALRQPDDAIVI